MAGCSHCERGMCAGKKRVDERFVREVIANLSEASRNMRQSMERLERVETPQPGDDQMLQRINASTEYLNRREPPLDDLKQLLQTNPSKSRRFGLFQRLMICVPALEGYTGVGLASQQDGCTFHSATVFQALDAIKRG